MSRRNRRSSRWLRAIAGTALLGCQPVADVVAPLQVHRAANQTEAEWATPVNLGLAINSSATEAQLGIAPNGKSLYVTSTRTGGFGDADIYVSSLRPDGRWAPLVNVGATVNSSALEASPTLSDDGHYLYFASRRPGGLGGLDCWRTHRTNPTDDFSWEAPENLGAAVNSTFDDADCVPAGNQDGGGEFWFASLNRPVGQGGYDIYKSDILPDGSFAPAQPVAELNHSGRDTRMTLTGNGLTIYFTTNRAGGLGGIDIWVSHRQTPFSPFCTPVTVGAPVNSSGDDRSPSITTNGNALYFSSSRAGGLGSDDVYMAERIDGPGHGCS